MLKKRQTKVIAYRNSKLPKPPTGLKNNDFDDINFLKGIKWSINAYFMFCINIKLQIKKYIEYLNY